MIIAPFLAPSVNMGPIFSLTSPSVSPKNAFLWLLERKNDFFDIKNFFQTENAKSHQDSKYHVRNIDFGPKMLKKVIFWLKSPLEASKRVFGAFRAQK